MANPNPECREREVVILELEHGIRLLTPARPRRGREGQFAVGQLSAIPVASAKPKNVDCAATRPDMAE